MNETVANRVQAIREAQGKSRQQLANAAGTSPQYIHQVETGEIKNPGVKISLRLADALGVPVDVLFPPVASNAQPEPASSLRGEK